MISQGLNASIRRALFAASTSVPKKKKKKKRHVDVFCSLNNIWQRLGHILTGAVSLLLKEKKTNPPDIISF
jgi:hypothetical protein